MSASHPTFVAVLALHLFAASLGCGQSREAVAVPEHRKLVLDDAADDGYQHVEHSQLDARFEKRLLQIVGEYREQYPIVVHGLQWSPTMCLPPPLSLSEARSDAPHGDKLYYPYVKLAEPYSKGADRPQPVGQVIVKEAWFAEEVEENVSITTASAQRDGKTYVPGRPAGLFVMFKEDPASPGTDDGWVYGTVTPDHKRVTFAGRGTSCMDCHREAKPDRVFGVRKEP
jgi:hypothetical protein